MIDPVLSYAALFGGGSIDEGRAIAVDSTGAAFIVGNTASGNFPVVNGKPGRYSFVAKVNPAGNGLIYSTYLPLIGGGGSAYAIDPSGSVYLTRDGAPDFPVSGPVPLRACSGNGGPDVYVAKLSSDGASLVYSGCIGGSEPEYPAAIAADAAGNAYVTGFTQSPDFPLVNPLQSAPPRPNGFLTGFVFKVRPDGGLVYSTYLGGRSPDFLGGGSADFPRAIAADLAGNAYITGETTSIDFPLRNPIQDRSKAAPFPGRTSFVGKINPSGSDFVYSTYLGGSNSDAGMAIAADALGIPTWRGALRPGIFPSRPTLCRRASIPFSFSRQPTLGRTGFEATRACPDPLRLYGWIQRTRRQSTPSVRAASSKAVTVAAPGTPPT